MADTDSPWDEPFDDPEVHPDDGDDNLAALDFSYVDEQEVVEHATDSASLRGAEDTEDAEVDAPLFTVTSPDETVTVTTFLTGAVHRVELGPKATRLTERELAEEIRVIADLAAAKARSAVHGFLVEGMARLGHDTAGLSAGLARDMRMPTPEQAAEDAAQVFSTRYRNDDE